MRVQIAGLSAGNCNGGARHLPAARTVCVCYLERVEPADLTVKILQEMRDELRGINARLDASSRENAARFEAMTRENAARFEVIETTLRDLAQQLVVLGRGVKVAIDDRRDAIERAEDHERRIALLERKLGQ